MYRKNGRMHAPPLIAWPRTHKCCVVTSRCTKKTVKKFSSVQEGIYALGKSHMRSTPSLRSFPKRCLWNSSNVLLIDDDPLSSFQGRSSSGSSFHASLLQAIDGVMSLALCPQVVSQAPQHFRSSRSKPPVRVACPPPLPSLSAQVFVVVFVWRV